jgi:hypothetical protein
MGSGERGSYARGEAALEVAGQAAHEGEIEVRSRLQAAALGVERAGARSCALDQVVDQACVEVRLGEHAYRAQLVDLATQLGEALAARRHLRADRDRADHVEAVAALQVLVGVVEDDVGPACDRRQVAVELGGERLELGSQRRRIGLEDRRVGGVLGAQGLLDAIHHGDRVVRVEPRVTVDAIGPAGVVAVLAVAGLGMIVPLERRWLRRLSSFRRDASCSVTTSTVSGSDFTILAVNGSTVSDMRTNRSACCSARVSDGRSA